jgi:Integrase core domain/leucine-zipper of insertion element IS481
MNTENFRALCREYGISARVGYKWRDRFMAEDLSGMNDQSRRPHCCPRQLSDNGVPFASPNGLLRLSQLGVWWLALGIDLERSRPGGPQDNGGHERLHRDIARELEGVQHEERQAAFETCRREFNEERPHQALGMRVPAELYQPSVRKWKGGRSTPSEGPLRRSAILAWPHAE